MKRDFTKDVHYLDEDGLRVFDDEANVRAMRSLLPLLFDLRGSVVIIPKDGGYLIRFDSDFVPPLTGGEGTTNMDELASKLSLQSATGDASMKWRWVRQTHYLDEDGLLVLHEDAALQALLDLRSLLSDLHGTVVVAPVVERVGDEHQPIALMFQFEVGNADAPESAPAEASDHLVTESVVAGV